MSRNKPDWWPRCPYPETVFVMKMERYPEIVPDERVRTGLSGMLGREFWNIASDTIWGAMIVAHEDGEPCPFCEEEQGDG